MPLRIELVGHLYCPIIRCDWCGERIEQATDGNVEWRMGEGPEPTTGEIFFTHKRCCHKFEHHNGRRGRWYTTELIAFPVQVAANLGLNFKKPADVQKALRIAQIHSI